MIGDQTYLPYWPPHYPVPYYPPPTYYPPPWPPAYPWPAPRYPVVWCSAATRTTHH